MPPIWCLPGHEIQPEWRHHEKTIIAGTFIGRGAAWVRVLGEPRWAERSETDVRVWTRVESLFNLVFAASPMTVVCPYDERSVSPEIMRQAHLTHPHTVDDRGVSQSSDYTDPGRFTLQP